MKRRKVRLWQENEGKCFWCSATTIIIEKCGRQKRHYATLDHLRSRYHSARRETWYAGQEPRTVLACYACNNKRAEEEQRRVPIQELWRRSNSCPRYLYVRLWRLLISRLRPRTIPPTREARGKNCAIVR